MGDTRQTTGTERTGGAMPWSETIPIDECLRFVADVRRGSDEQVLW